MIGVPVVARRAAAGRGRRRVARRGRDIAGVAASAAAVQVREYLLAHPEVIPEAMQRLQDRNNAKVIAANRADILTPVGSAWAGNPNGDVTVVEYLDYNCGYCRASLPVVDQLIAADPKVKVIYRELPVLSPESDTAARYAIVAGRAGQISTRSIARSMPAGR